jgi:predicted nucleic acid-binding protein
VLLDSAVFVYAVGADHPYRAPCRRLLEAVAAGDLVAEVSALAVEECLHQRARRTGDRESAVRVASNIAALCTVHDLGHSELTLGLQLFADFPTLGARGALHAATAINHRIPTLVSPDRDFDPLPNLQRVEPADAVARLG